MGLLALGIHYQSASISVREQFALVGEAAGEMACVLMRKGLVSEALILCTCHRIEFYCCVPDPHSNMAQMAIVDCWVQESEGARDSLMPYLYMHSDISAVKHLMSVASGLNSMAVGETEIFGQIKQAYSVAFNAGTIGKTLHRLFQATFSVAKSVRSKTGIGSNPVSIGFAAAKLIAQRTLEASKNLKELSVLLIGAGEIIRLTALHLQKLGICHWKIANRSEVTAKTLANSLTLNGEGVQVVPYQYLADCFADVDVVITATSSPLPVVKTAWIANALTLASGKNMLLLDLALPRDIEPEVALLAGIALYTVDDLQDIVSINLNIRQEAASLAEKMIHARGRAFMDELRLESSLSLIRNLRDRAEQLRDEALSDAMKKLDAGQPAEMVLQRLACGLTNQWLHHPTKRLRKAGIEGDESRLLFTRELFGFTELEKVQSEKNWNEKT